MLLSRIAILIAASACLPALADQNSDWPFLGGNRQSQQYFASDQINAQNIGSLGVLWYSDLPDQRGAGRQSPGEGWGYLPERAPRRRARDRPQTGKTLWTYGPPFDFTGYSVASMTVVHYTRGLGIDDQHVYLGAGCQLIALDRQTGHKVWDRVSVILRAILESQLSHGLAQWESLCRRH